VSLLKSKYILFATEFIIFL